MAVNLSECEALKHPSGEGEQGRAHRRARLYRYGRNLLIHMWNAKSTKMSLEDSPSGFRCAFDVCETWGSGMFY